LHLAYQGQGVEPAGGQDGAEPEEQEEQLRADQRAPEVDGVDGLAAADGEPAGDGGQAEDEAEDEGGGAEGFDEAFDLSAGARAGVGMDGLEPAEDEGAVIEVVGGNAAAG